MQAAGPASVCASWSCGSDYVPTAATIADGHDLCPRCVGKCWRCGGPKGGGAQLCPPCRSLVENEKREK